MFGSLYRYELKKIFLRPYVPVLLVLILAVTLFLNLSPLWEPDDVIYVENGELVFDTVSRYEAIQLERRFSQEDTGTLLDNQASDSVRDMNRYYRKSVSLFPGTALRLSAPGAAGADRACRAAEPVSP